jgi:ATP-binding cassette, subfamily B, bacterial
MDMESVPDPVLRALGPHDTLRLAIPSDLSLDGCLARHWLVLVDGSVVILIDGPGPRVLERLPVERVESFRAQPGVGSGCLQARAGDAWVDLIRYSNGLARRFLHAAACLEEFRKEGRLGEADDKPDDRRCPGCGLALGQAGDVCPRCLDRGAVVGRVWDLVRPYRGAAVLICVLTLLGVAAELAPPKLQQYLVDHVLQPDGTRTPGRELAAVLLLIVGGLACTRVVLSVINALKGVVASRVGTAMTSDLRVRLVEHLQKLSVDYYDRQPVGVLMSRVAHDTEALYGLIHQFTGGFLLQILQVVGVGVMLFTLHPRLALWTLIPMPLVVGGSVFFWRRVYPKYHRYWDSTSKQAGALAGMLSGIRVVKAFAQEQREYERFQAKSDTLRNSRLEVEVSSATFSAVMQLVFSLGGLIVWYVGGRDVLGSTMTLGALMAFLAYLAMFYAPLTTLAQLTTWLTSFLTASQRVFELLDTPPRILDPDTPAKVPGVRGRIRFENVAFGYDRNRPVLRDFSLDIPPGETVGVVGRSGSGKTTLVNLICRFYDVESGRVTIDGRDVRDLAREDLRRHIGVVLQEPFLFRGTIWENLVYGRPDARPEDALAAARGANAHEFVLRRPLAYDTPLGERGAGLSGGEKQRLSIARTLLYDPRILILDEATSSVDTESEKAIQDALARLTRGRTTIAIAHRLSTLRNADRIIVLDRGKLVEEGSHADLLARDGIYARLVRIQTLAAARAPVEEMAAVESRPAPSSDKTKRRRRKRRRKEWDGPAADVADFAPRWLCPDATRLRLADHGALQVTVGEEVRTGVFAVRALPASRPEQFISLCYADADGHEHEVGMIRDLTAWPAQARALVEQALYRRYFVRRITAVEGIELRYGLLSFRVETDRGPARFTMRNSHGQAQDYGPAGKILIDVDDNRYVLEDVDALPRRQHLLFRRYVYW